MKNYKNFIIEEMNKAHILVAKSEQIKRDRKLAEAELEEVYKKAEAFDEIVNELYYQLQNLERWQTLDQKYCQTLKQILEENTKEEKHMKLYQVEHDNCEPYEDNHSYREDKIYTNKENLIKRIKAEGYEEKRSGYLQDGDTYYYKDNIEDVPLFREDMITIHELEVINNNLEIDGDFII